MFIEDFNTAIAGYSSSISKEDKMLSTISDGIKWLKFMGWKLMENQRIKWCILTILTAIGNSKSS